MNPITQARAALTNALTDTTHSVLDHVPEMLTAPAYIVQAGTPWITTAGTPYGTHLVTWLVTCVVDVATNQVATHNLDDLVHAALERLDVNEVTEPYVYASNTALHLAADITVTITI